MHSNIPYFSIIITAYNAEKFIECAILSVLNQSFQNFEIIVVNDGSTDKTKDIINEYTKKNEKIKTINHIYNESLHIARLDGVNVSIGKYIIFLDSDDYFVNTAFSILFNEIQKNHDYDIYEFGYIRQPSGEIVLPSFTKENRFKAFFSINDFPPPTMWNKVYNSTVIKKAFSSLERVYINNTEDTYESIVISFYTRNIYIINKIIINYSIGTGISTTYKDYNKILDFLASVKKTLLFIQNFLEKENQNISINNLQYQFLTHVIKLYIITRQEIKEKETLFLLLPEYFDIKIIMKYLFNHEELYNKIVNVINSKDYKLGKILLYPLRKIKKLIKL
jgi:glycosyltransferase involved in cell wall biosynthesis